MKADTYAHLLQIAKDKLKAVTESERLEADILLAHTLKKPRSFLYAHPDDVIENHEQQLFFSYLERRLNREPIAYILGEKEFWSLPFYVTKDTLIPRPETELLVEYALKQFPKEEKVKVVDLGTGSGAIALSIAHERPNWSLFATDKSDAALTIASKNAQRFALNNVSFLQGNWCDVLAPNFYDLIISNPPYIAEDEWMAVSNHLQYEPKEALLSADNGLKDIKAIAKYAKKHLKAMGKLIIEHGALQGRQVQEILIEAGFNEVEIHVDYAGKARFSVGF